MLDRTSLPLPPPRLDGREELDLDLVSMVVHEAEASKRAVEAVMAQEESFKAAPVCLVGVEKDLFLESFRSGVRLCPTEDMDKLETSFAPHEIDSR